MRVGHFKIDRFAPVAARDAIALYTAAFVGLAPVGALLADGLATGLGAGRTLLLGGLRCVAGALALARRAGVVGRAAGDASRSPSA